MFNDKVSVSQLVELRNELINLKNEGVNDIKLKNKDITMIVESLIEEKKESRRDVSSEPTNGSNSFVCCQ